MIEVMFIDVAISAKVLIGQSYLIDAIPLCEKGYRLLERI
jgi:hypothetical protein